MSGYPDRETLIHELRLATAAANGAGLTDLVRLLVSASQAITGEDKAWTPVMDKIAELRKHVNTLSDATLQQTALISYLRQMLETRTPELRQNCTWKEVGGEWLADCGGSFRVDGDIVYRSEAIKYCMFCGYKTREESKDHG